MTRTAKITVAGAVVAMTMLLAACGEGASLAQAGPCAETILEVEGQVAPESSGLTCSQIEQLITSVPSTPGGFLFSSGNPRETWKCHLYPSLAESTNLLTCARDNKEFSVRRVG
jgi:hypothetical protein